MKKQSENLLLERGEEGFIGRDPRTVSRAEFEAAGHEAASPMRVIRAKCLDCSHTAQEVRLCVQTDCPCWPYRMGTNPFRAVSEARREAGRRIGLARANSVVSRKSHLGNSDAASFDGSTLPEAEAARNSGCGEEDAA